MTKEKWKTLLNLFVTIITAIAATLTTQGCMRCSAAAPAAPRERMNACRMRGALLPSAPHDNTRQHERVFCYIVTLLHCYIKVVSQCSLYSVIQVSDLQRVSRGVLNNVCVSRGLNNVCVSCGLKAQKYLAQGKRSGALGWGKQM